MQGSKQCKTSKSNAGIVLSTRLQSKAAFILIIIIIIIIIIILKFPENKIK